jgi:hypothetical protein
LGTVLLFFFGFASIRVATPTASLLFFSTGKRKVTKESPGQKKCSALEATARLPFFDWPGFFFFPTGDPFFIFSSPLLYEFKFTYSQNFGVDPSVCCDPFFIVLLAPPVVIV